ncbi:MAG: hypothetical protein ABIY71_02150, partial [Flavobacteriales bacterium]
MGITCKTMPTKSKTTIVKTKEMIVNHKKTLKLLERAGPEALESLPPSYGRQACEPVRGTDACSYGEQPDSKCGESHCSWW